MIDIHPFPTLLISGKTDAGSTLKNFAAMRHISRFIPSFAIAEIVLAISSRDFRSSGEKPSLFLEINFTDGPMNTTTKTGFFFIAANSLYVWCIIFRCNASLFGFVSLSSKTALADFIPFMALYSSPETVETTQSNEIAMNRLSSAIIFLFIIVSSSLLFSYRNLPEQRLLVREIHLNRLLSTSLLFSFLLFFGLFKSN